MLMIFKKNNENILFLQNLFHSEIATFSRRDYNLKALGKNA